MKRSFWLSYISFTSSRSLAKASAVSPTEEYSSSAFCSVCELNPIPSLQQTASARARMTASLSALLASQKCSP
jgi:hypothetical protein